MQSFVQNQITDDPQAQWSVVSICPIYRVKENSCQLPGNQRDSRNQAKEKPMNATLVRNNLKPELKRNVWETIENRFDQFILDMVNMLRVLTRPDNSLYAFC